MTKLILLALAVLLVVSWIGRSPRLRRAIWYAALAVALYGVLKATGAIEALAPDRNGVF